MVLYADETILRRCALPRAGWWRTAQRTRLRTRPLRPSQITRDEGRKRHAWVPYRAWRRSTSGVLLNVLGAVQSGTSKGVSKIVPHCDAQELRQYLQPGRATCSKTGPAGVMGVDRSGIQRAHKLDTTLDRYQSTFRCHFFPAHCGHHRNPMEGFWRVMKDAIGVGRCFAHLPL